MEITLKELLNALQPSNTTDAKTLDIPVGTKQYIRGAIYSWCGLVESVTSTTVKLSQASYVGTDGRYSQAVEHGLENANNSEVEYVGDLALSASMVVDWVELPSLPRSTK